MAVLFLAGRRARLGGRPGAHRRRRRLPPPASADGARERASRRRTRRAPAADRASPTSRRRRPALGAGLTTSLTQDHPIDPEGRCSARRRPATPCGVLLPVDRARCSLRYRLPDDRRSRLHWDTDNDLYAYLRLKYRDEDLPGWSGSFHGRVTVDLDDFGNVDGFYVFDSIRDTYDDRLNGRVYHAYAELPTSATARLRRPPRSACGWTSASTSPIDGIRVESARSARGSIGFAAFVGIPHYFYDAVTSGDFVAGAQVFGKPWKGAEMGARLDATSRTTSNVYGDRGQPPVQPDVEPAHRPDDHRPGSQYQHLDEDPRRVRAIVDAVWPNVRRGRPRRTSTRCSTTRRELVYDFDYYYWTALALEPYWQANASASKGIGSCFDVEVGFTIRRLYDEVGRRAPTTASGSSTSRPSPPTTGCCRGLSLTLSGEYWNSTDDFWHGGLRHRVPPVARAGGSSLGTDYAAYSTTSSRMTERENVYSVLRSRRRGDRASGGTST